MSNSTEQVLLTMLLFELLRRRRNRSRSSDDEDDSEDSEDDDDESDEGLTSTQLQQLPKVEKREFCRKWIQEQKNVEYVFSEAPELLTSPSDVALAAGPSVKAAVVTHKVVTAPNKRKLDETMPSCNGIVANQLPKQVKVIRVADVKPSVCSTVPSGVVAVRVPSNQKPNAKMGAVFGGPGPTVPPSAQLTHVRMGENLPLRRRTVIEEQGPMGMKDLSVVPPPLRSAEIPPPLSWPKKVVRGGGRSLKQPLNLTTVTSTVKDSAADAVPIVLRRSARLMQARKS